VCTAGEQRISALETKAVAAHRAYIEALAKWERAFRAAYDAARRTNAASDPEQLRRCASAEAEKERRRIVFRDLCDALGYVPEGNGVTRQHTDTSSRTG
jgi:hypothetical protein